MSQQTARVTIQDVAREANVSVATVSKVLNSRYGVSAATSQRVQHVIDQMGYETSLVARSLRSLRTNVIGILVAEFEPFSTEILKGVSQAISGTGYELLAYSGGDHASMAAGWERRSLSRLSGTLIDGAIIVTPTVADFGASAPVVAIDPHAGPAGTPTVDSDNYGGAVLATEHLLALGHQRIAFLAGREDLESSRLREEGFRSTMKAAGLDVDPELVRVGGYRRSSAHDPAEELLTHMERPTAIFAANDLSAIEAMEVAKELGIDVPSELSVVGFDNVPETALVTPPLTTINQPIQRMGAEALRMLIQLIEGAEVTETHVRLPTSLVVRSSTQPPNADAV